MPLALTTGTSSHPKNTLQQGKFKIKVLVLLHILIPGVMLSSLKTINPWLSACDLAQPAPPDLQGSCSAAHLSPRTMPQRDDEIPSCPMSCPLNQSSSDSQCLAYLDETRRNAICNFSSGSGSEWLKNFLGQIRLRHCCEYKIIESLSGTLLDRVLAGKDDCYQIIDSLVDVDNLAARVSCEFTEVLSRYDCGQPYSVRFSCEDCKEAYRRWVCSSLVPYFSGTTRVRPCRSVCQAVEQKCPYFLPENRAPSLPTQYAGEPTFLCMDPNIPETGEQLKRSLYPEKDTCCVKPCGTPRDGLCIEKGRKCEELAPYENATLDECNGTDISVGRVANDECPGPATHPSFKGSAPSLKWSSSRPFLTLLSACVSASAAGSTARHRFAAHLALALAAVIVIHFYCYVNHHYNYYHYCYYYYYYSFSLVYLVACLYILSDVSSSSSSRRRRLTFAAITADHLGRKIRTFYHLIKFSKLIFNYFKFNSNKWQYYFILISVNLRCLRRGASRRRRAPETTPTPGSTSPPSTHRRNNNGTSGHLTRHLYNNNILSKSAQKLIAPRRRERGSSSSFRDLTTYETSVFDYLVIDAATIQWKRARLSDTTISTNDSVKVKLHSTTMIIKLTLKTLPTVELFHGLSRMRRERCNAFNANNNNEKQFMKLINRSSYLNIRLLLTLMNVSYIMRTNVVDTSICMFLHSSRMYKYVWYYIIEKCYFYYNEYIMLVIYVERRVHASSDASLSPSSLSSSSIETLNYYYYYYYYYPFILSSHCSALIYSH